MMNLSKHNNRSLFFVILILAFSLSSVALTRAQESKQTLLPTGRVNDFAGVLDGSAKERIENSLANLKERGGIEFSVVLVKSTEGKDIYDYSLQLARTWKIGSMQSRDKSLLLVISTDDGKFITQVSRGFRSDMPDGLIGEMGIRMQAPLSKGNYNEALTSAVQTFIKQVSEKQGFSVEGIDQRPTTASAQTTQITQTTPPATDTLPKESVATAEPSPSPESTPKETATKQTNSAQRPLREVFTKDSGANTGTTTGNAQDKAELDAL